MKIRSTEDCLQLERWQGLPHINKVNGMKVTLFILFIHETEESLSTQFVQPLKNQSMKILNVFPQNYIVHL